MCQSFLAVGFDHYVGFEWVWGVLMYRAVNRSGKITTYARI